METKDDYLSGIIELNWPGKQSMLKHQDGKWILSPFDSIEEKHALIFDETIGEGENCCGYAIKADIMSALEAMRPYASGAIQLVYFDAPRISAFQSEAQAGYAVSTWLSLIQQSAKCALPCLKRNGFFALHTDEEMAHYARVVLEEVFSPSHYVGTFAWQKQYAPQNDHSVPTDVLDYITVFSKSAVEDLEKIGLLVTPNDLKDDGDFRGCFIDGHKGARSGSESTKFKVNTSPYRWEIIDSNLPEGKHHFDPILGVLYFETVDTVGSYHINVQATDKNGSKAQMTIPFKVRAQDNIHDEFSLPQRIWWLMKNDNDIEPGGKLKVCNLPSEELIGIKGQKFSIVLKAKGGQPFTMRNDSPGVGRYWEFGKRTLIEGIAQAKASFGPSGTALPSIKKYFNREDAKKIQSVMNYLPWYDFGDTQDATQHCKSLKQAEITTGDIDMRAKPQKLLGHLIMLLSPNKSDLVVSLGETNGVFASVANKLGRRFIHVIGSDTEDIGIWDATTSRRILATFKGHDIPNIEGNDALSEGKGSDGTIVIFKMSESYLSKDIKNGDLEPHFSESEKIEDFYAGLSGAFSSQNGSEIYTGLSNHKVLVLPCGESLDAMAIDGIKRKFPDSKITIIYESSEGDVSAPKKVTLKRAPFDLI